MHLYEMMNLKYCSFNLFTSVNKSGVFKKKKIEHCIHLVDYSLIWSKNYNKAAYASVYGFIVSTV